MEGVADIRMVGVADIRMVGVAGTTGIRMVEADTTMVTNKKANAGRLLIGVSATPYIMIWKEAGMQDHPKDTALRNSIPRRLYLIETILPIWWTISLIHAPQ